MRRIPVRLLALVVGLALGAAAAPAQAVQSTITVLLDLDNAPGTGCTISGFAGVEQRVVTTVQTTTGPNAATVTRIEGFDCASTQTFVDTTPHPVGIGNGALGLDVIETYWPTSLSTVSPLAVIHLGVTNENANGGFDSLFTTDGTRLGGPILFGFGSIVEIPTLSQWGLLLLALALAASAAVRLRRRPLRALLTVALVLGLAGVAWAVVSDLDGRTTAEWNPASRLAFDGSATDDGAAIAALHAMRDDPTGRIYFRVDASLVFNTPPVVTTTPGATAFTEDGGPVVVDGGVTVTDSDSPSLASATVTIGNPQDGAAETLAASVCPGLVVTAGLNSLSITGSQPPATYQACLRSVSFDDSSQNPGTAARTISFVADDGIVASPPASRTVTVAAVNDAPVVTTSGGATAFTEDAGPVMVDGALTVSDVDDANLASATVAITNPQDGASEVLAASACPGLVVTPGPNSLTVTGSQPVAAYQACLRSVAYDNASQNPDATPRTVAFAVNDGTAGSAPANKTVTVTAVDDAPVVTTTGGATAFTEDGGPVGVDGGVTVTDADDPNLASATVTLTNPQDGAAEVLAATTCVGITVTPGLNSLSLTGSATVAAYQTCFQSVTYDNTSQDPTAAPSRVVRFVANDGTANSNNGDKTLTVAPVNDAPVVTTAVGNTAFTEDGGPVAVDGALTVTDVDDANLASAVVTITNPQDGAAEVLAATSCAGLTVTPGLNSLSITGSQPLAAYQTCLRSVTYDNTSQDPAVAPNAHRALRRQRRHRRQQQRRQARSVGGVNDVPVVTTTGGATAFTEDGGPVVVDPGVTVTDADSPNLASGDVTITNLQDWRRRGARRDTSGTAITVYPALNPGASRQRHAQAAYQTCCRSVTYADTSQNPSTRPARSIDFMANDGTADGNNGDQEVTVTAVNDAPVVTTSGGATAFTEDGGPVVVDAGVTVTDVDSTNLASATVTITNPQDGARDARGHICAGLTVTPGVNACRSPARPPATYQGCCTRSPTRTPRRTPRHVTRVHLLRRQRRRIRAARRQQVDHRHRRQRCAHGDHQSGNTAFTEDGGPVVVDPGVTVDDFDNANLASAR